MHQPHLGKKKKKRGGVAQWISPGIKKECSALAPFEGCVDDNRTISLVYTNTKFKACNLYDKFEERGAQSV